MKQKKNMKIKWYIFVYVALGFELPPLDWEGPDIQIQTSKLFKKHITCRLVSSNQWTLKQKTFKPFISHHRSLKCLFCPFLLYHSVCVSMFVFMYTRKWRTLKPGLLHWRPVWRIWCMSTFAGHFSRWNT